MKATRDVLEIHNVTVTGDSRKPALVFAHGFGTDQSAWREVKEAFSESYRIVLYDNVGSGKVDARFYSPALYGSLHSYADDLIAICESLAIRDAVVVGHSVSGIISLLAAIQAPHLFSKLICMNSSPRYLNDASDGYIGGFEQQDLDQLFASMQQNYFAWVSGFAPLAMNMPHHPGLGSEFARTLGAVRPDIALSVVRTIFQCDHRTDLPFVLHPVFLIGNREDMVVPREVGRYMQSHLPNGHLTYIDAQGHFPHMSAPAEVIRAIQAVLG